jgi:hypothetical protein
MNISMKLIAALIAIESGGDDLAVWDKGKSVGCLQIQKAVITDVNRYYGRNYQLYDRYVRAHSIEIAKLYLAYWGRAYERETKKQVTDEVLARIWNGGPKGYEKEKTIQYWHKVKEKMK